MCECVCVYIYIYTYTYPPIDDECSEPASDTPAKRDDSKMEKPPNFNLRTLTYNDKHHLRLLRSEDEIKQTIFEFFVRKVSEI